MEDYILWLKVRKLEIKITMWFIADTYESPARSLLH